MFKKSSLNKKSISGLVATMLLLVATVISFTLFQNWYSTYEQNTLTNIKILVSPDSINIMAVDSNYVYLRNFNNLGIDYDKIKIAGIDCQINGTLNPNQVTKIEIRDCGFNKTLGTKEVAVFTNGGIFKKILVTKLVYRSPLSILFNLGTTCPDISYTKLYGLDSSTNSHIENATSNLYTYSICAKHDYYTLGNTCQGSNYKKLFYLGDYTNSHFYTDNTTAYNPPGISNYYNWQTPCVNSNNGTITTYIASSKPDKDAVCIGSIAEVNDTYGSPMGDCSAYSTILWLNIK